MGICPPLKKKMTNAFKMLRMIYNPACYLDGMKNEDVLRTFEKNKAGYLNRSCGKGLNELGFFRKERNLALQQTTTDVDKLNVG